MSTARARNVPSDIPVAGNLHGKRTGGIGKGSAGDAGAVELTPSGSDADLFGDGEGAGFGRAKFGVDEPEGLREEEEKQGGGEELRTSEALAGEKFGHEVGRCVLP